MSCVVRVQRVMFIASVSNSYYSRAPRGARGVSASAG
eukprot:COSAG01_NODE_67808_length_266_cov_0.544910_2_plen_36_part_01